MKKSSSRDLQQSGPVQFRKHLLPSEKLGLARLSFEKAARLSDDPDINANIRFVNSNIIDRVAEPERGFTEAVLLRFHTLLSLRDQLWLEFILLLILLIIISIGIFTSGNKRLWLIYLTSLFLFVVLFNGLSMGIKIYEAENVNYAINCTTPPPMQRISPMAIRFYSRWWNKIPIRKTLDTWALNHCPNGVSRSITILGRI